MNLVTVDIESFWSSDYSLSKLSPLEYVMGDQWQTISCAIKVNNWPTDIFFGEEKVRRAFHGIRGTIADGLVIGHNLSGFDAYVLAYRFGIRPKLWGCTLAKLVEHYGLGKKDNSVLVQTRGKRLEDFTEDELERMRTYNREDTDQCHALFHKLRGFHNATELWQIDALIRMRTEPAFTLDVPLLETAASIERDRKHKALLDLASKLRGHADEVPLDWSNEDAVTDYVRSELASAPKFSALLEQLGAEVPMKPSPKNPEKLIPALAKTDAGMEALQESDDPLVAAAARARLDVKSTLLETRIQKFLTAGSLARGMLPVPIRYAGADTTGRDSGEEYNCFTGDVEVLTSIGWVRFDQWDGSPVMQWWPDGRASFEMAPGYLRKPYRGDVVEVRGVLLDATMTPEHRLVSLRDGRIVERTAGWLAESSGFGYIPTSGRWVGAVVSEFTPAQARLMVAIAADGCTVPRATQRPTIQIGLRRHRKVERLRSLLDEVGCAYTVKEYPPQVGHTGDHPTTVFFLRDCPYEKGFGSWVLRLSREALDALVDELTHWDGWKHQKTGADEFSTSDLEQAHWVALAWHMSGSPTTVREYRGRFQLHRRASPFTSVKAKDVRVRQYDGEVFCASVESSYIFIRRHGKIAVAGQCQNLPRIIPGQPKPSDALRNSLRAPKGKVVIVADQSGIELRVNHFLWKVPSSMALYQASPDKADLYREFAARHLWNIDPADISKTQRQVGKVAQLGLGFGSGHKTFQRIAWTQGRVRLPLDDTERTADELTCEEIVASWREAYSEIADGWKACGRALRSIMDEQEVAVDPWGLVHTCAEGLVLPSGRLIRYPDLRMEDDGEWPDGRKRRSAFYAHGRHKARITGPKADENIVQALARDSIFECAVEFYRRTGLRPALRVHDELVYVVEEAHAQDLLAELQSVLRTPPKWWPDLVVWSEGDAAASYGAAK